MKQINETLTLFVTPHPNFMNSVQSKNGLALAIVATLAKSLLVASSLLSVNGQPRNTPLHSASLDF